MSAKVRLYFSCEGPNSEYETTLTHEIEEEDWDINEFYSFCRKCGFAAGFADETVREAFPEN